MVPEIDVVSFKKRLDARAEGKDDFFVLDVRNPNEQQIALVPGTDKLIPVSELAARIDEIKSQIDLCHAFASVSDRSRVAAESSA